MNNSSSSKVNETFSKDPDLVTINEKVNLLKDQHEILDIICKVYQMSVSEYMQQALVEAMRFDIEEGNFSDALLEKIGGLIYLGEFYSIDIHNRNILLKDLAERKNWPSQFR